MSSRDIKLYYVALYCIALYCIVFLRYSTVVDSDLYDPIALGYKANVGLTPRFGVILVCLQCIVFAFHYIAFDPIAMHAMLFLYFAKMSILRHCSR